jgi:hypothetical protein
LLIGLRKPSHIDQASAPTSFLPDQAERLFSQKLKISQFIFMPFDQSWRRASKQSLLIEPTINKSHPDLKRSVDKHFSQGQL